MWPCLPVRKHLTDAMDGQPLPPLLAFYVGFHRMCCPFCRRVERSLNRTQQAARALRDLPFDEGNDGNEKP